MIIFWTLQNFEFLFKKEWKRYTAIKLDMGNAYDTLELLLESVC